MSCSGRSGLIPRPSPSVLKGPRPESLTRFRVPLSRGRSASRLLTFHVDTRQDVLEGGCVQQVTHFLQGLGRSRGRREGDGQSRLRLVAGVRGVCVCVCGGGGTDWCRCEPHSPRACGFSTDTPSSHPCRGSAARMAACVAVCQAHALTHPHTNSTARWGFRAGTSLK